MLVCCQLCHGGVFHLPVLSDVDTSIHVNFVAEVCCCNVGVDSFYEYLVKAYILFGKEEYWRMFQSAYVAVQKYFRHGPWYCI